MRDGRRGGPAGAGWQARGRESPGWEGGEEGRPGALSLGLEGGGGGESWVRRCEPADIREEGRKVMGAGRGRRRWRSCDPEEGRGMSLVWAWDPQPEDTSPLRLES